MIAAVYARKRRATWLGCVLLLAGCTTHGLIGALPTIPNPTDAAEIVVIREWRFIGGGANLEITLDGAPVYGISTGEHVSLRVAPGYHVVGVFPKGPWKNESTVNVQAAPQQRYYFRIETSNPLAPDFILQPVGAEVGQALMAKTTRISP
jgi:hypothetical protein